MNPKVTLWTETPTEALPVRCAAPKLSATADGLGRYCEYSQVLVEHDGRPSPARREPRRMEVGAERRKAVGALPLSGYSRVLTGTEVVPGGWKWAQTDAKPWLHCNQTLQHAKAIYLYVDIDMYRYI